MQKKATSVLLMLFEVLAVVLVSYIMIELSTAISESSSVKKLSMVNDLVLLENTLAATPASTLILLRHDPDYSEFIMEFEDNKVKVYMDERESEPKRFVRYSIPYSDLIILPQRIANSPVSLIRVLQEGNQIKFSDKEINLSQKEQIPSIITKDLQWRNKAVIFAPHIINDEKNAFAIIFNRCTNGQPKAEQLDINEIPYPRDQLAALIVFQPMEQNPEILFTISPKYSARSRKLAVLINNALVEKFPEITPRISTSEEESLTKADTAVMLKLPEKIQKPEIISELLCKALQHYYEK